MRIGTRVRYINIDTEEEKATGYFPPIGTLGTVIRVYEAGLDVKWDSGTKDPGEWYCLIDDVEEVEEVGEGDMASQSKTVYLVLSGEDIFIG